MFVVVKDLVGRQISGANAKFLGNLNKCVGVVEVDHVYVPVDDFAKGFGVFFLVIDHDFDAEVGAAVLEFCAHIVKANFDNVGTVFLMHVAYVFNVSHVEFNGKFWCNFF